MERKNKVSREDIEKAALNSLDRKFYGMSVQTKMDFNDKTPITDGNIFLYDPDGNSEYSVEDLLIKLPVQVKGTTTRGNKFKTYRNYRITKRMLNGIYSFGGIFLFVVYVTDDDNQNKIYFRELSKMVVERFIKQLHGRKSENIRIYEFPESNEEAFTVMYRSADQIQRQGTIVNANFNLKPKRFELNLYGNEKLENVLKKEETTLYVVENGTNIPYATINPDTIQISKGRSLNIKFKNGLHFFRSHINYFDKYVEILTGEQKKISIILLKNGKLKLTFNNSKVFSYQVTNTNILLNFLDNGIIYMNNKKFEFNFNPNNSKIINFKKSFINFQKKLADIKKLRDSTHLPFFDTNSSKKTNYVLKSVLQAYRTPENFSKATIYREKVEDKVFYLLFVPSKNKPKPILQSLFKKSSSDIIKYNYEHNGIKFSLNPYTYGRDPIENIGDFCPDLVFDWYKKTKIDSNGKVKFANDYSFKLLRAFNKTKNNIYLDLAIKITKMIFEYNPKNDIAFLNYIQANIRVNKIDEMQLNRLLDILKEGTTREQLAAKILLDLSDDALFKTWVRMNSNEKKSFQKWPIFDLVSTTFKQKILM